MRVAGRSETAAPGEPLPRVPIPVFLAIDRPIGLALGCPIIRQRAFADRVKNISLAGKLPPQVGSPHEKEQGHTDDHGRNYDVITARSATTAAAVTSMVMVELVFFFGRPHAYFSACR